MSAKNTLQEYYQKRNLATPVYKCTRRGGEDHTPLFKATVTLYNKHVFRGKGQNKKKAEFAAAKKALKYLNKKLASHSIPENREKKFPKRSSSSPLTGSPRCLEGRTLKEKFIGGGSTGIFIDLENKHGIVEELSKLTDSDIIAFASTDHPSILKLRDKFKESYNSIQLIEVPCTRKDGADVGLMLYIGVFLEKYSNIIIVTSDHFGDALADCINKFDQMGGISFKPPKAVCCRTLKSILKEL